MERIIIKKEENVESVRNSPIVMSVDESVAHDQKRWMLSTSTTMKGGGCVNSNVHHKRDYSLQPAVSPVGIKRTRQNSISKVNR